MTRPWIIAHRGANDEAPENTTSAFDRALAYPVDGIETDVQMTADGELVLYHDKTLFRATGRRKRISDLSLAALQKMDWGGWHSPQFSGEPLLTLKKALALYAGRTRLLVEIKSRARDRRTDRRLTIADKTLKELEKPDIRPHWHTLFVLCFDPVVLRRLARRTSGLKYVLNLPEPKHELRDILSALEKSPESAAHLHALCLKEKNLSDIAVSTARFLGKSVFTYSCNTRRQVNNAMAFGVDALLTDRPGRLTARLR